MLDTQRITQIQKQAKSEDWSFPKYFNALKEAGITFYEVWIENFHICFKQGSQEWIAPPPEGLQQMTVAESFDEDALLKALERRRKRETTYAEFLRDIAAAGVAWYKANMPEQTVTYIGKNDKDCHAQHIPSL